MDGNVFATKLSLFIYIIPKIVTSYLKYYYVLWCIGTDREPGIEMSTRYSILRKNKLWMCQWKTRNLFI